MELKARLHRAMKMVDDLVVEAEFASHGGGKEGAGQQRWADWKALASKLRDEIEWAIAEEEAPA